MDPPGRRTLALDGHVQRVDGDLGVQGLAHGPTDNLACVHVEDRGQVQPAFCGEDVGEVGEPGLFRMRGLKVTGEPVWGDRVAMAAVGALAGRGSAASPRRPARRISRSILERPTRRPWPRSAAWPLGAP